MSKHTAGPWKLRESRTVLHRAVCFDVYKASGKYVAEVSSKANANLIAAAPDMFEALSELRKQIALEPMVGDWAGKLLIIEAALAKARGEL